MGWFSRLFGQCGKVRFAGVFNDGQGFTGKTEIETFNVTLGQLEEKLKEIVYVESGKRVKSLTVTAFVEC